MNHAGPGRQAATEERRAIAEDLGLLCVLHDREADAGMLARLRAAPFEEWLGLRLLSPDGRAALAALDRALADLPAAIDETALDRLASDYARVYLTHHYGASPEESVWLTAENIVRQEPMFEVRAFYRRYGLEVESWRERPDDHLVIQVTFLTHLLARFDDDAALVDAARFLDRHLLVWIGDFAATLAGRAGPGFYAGLALVTTCYLDALRDYLVEVTGEARRDAEFRAEARRRREMPAEDAENTPYLPGTGPGW